MEGCGMGVGEVVGEGMLLELFLGMGMGVDDEVWGVLCVGVGEDLKLNWMFDFVLLMGLLFVM